MVAKSPTAPETRRYTTLMTLFLAIIIVKTRGICRVVSK